LDVRRCIAGARRWRRLTRTRRQCSYISGFLAFRVETVEDGPDRELIAGMEPYLFDQSAIDTNTIPAAQVADQDAIVSHGQTTMPSRDFWRIDSDVTIEMSADQEDRSMQGDLRCGSRAQGDESE
jgi:hypothetical protein